MSDDNLKISRHRLQQAFVSTCKSHRIGLFVGGLQGGKTVAGADAVWERLYVDEIPLPPQARNAYPEVWIVSKTYSLCETAWNCFVDRWGDYVLSNTECLKLGLHRGDTNTKWLRPRSDGKPIRVRLRTAEDPENLRATQNLILVWADEAAYFKETAWLNLLGRGIVTPTQYVITTTPKGKNWLYRLVYLPGKTKQDNGIGVVESRSIDNPWASREYLETLRKKFGEQYAAQELDAMFVENTGLVYNFDRTAHMGKPPLLDEFENIVFGVDPGYGDEYAVGVWGRTPAGVWWCLEEYYKKRVTTELLLPWFERKAKKYSPSAIYVDKRRPSDYLHISKYLKQKGFKTSVFPNIEIYGETDRRTIMPMIRFCQQLLASGKLFISEGCPWHAEEFEAYHFKDLEERNAGENPVDWKNHCFVAGTLVATKRGEIPIESVLTSDFAMTRGGWRRVKKAWMTRRGAQTFTVHLSNKVTLTATKDHRVWVDGRGWVSIEFLKPGDNVLLCRPMLSSSRASRIDAIQNQVGCATGGIINPQVARRCTGLSGSTITDPYRTTATSTTKMGIPSTTTSQTLPAYRQKRIRKRTGRRLDRIHKEITAMQSAPLPPLGTGATSAGSGTVNMLSSSRQERHPRQRCASNVGTFTRANDPSGFALTHVSRHGGVELRETTFSESALYAGRVFRFPDSAKLSLAAVRVERVIESGYADVYSLHVDDVHEFIANGILVSNCLDAMRYAICSVEDLRVDKSPRYRGGQDMMPRSLARNKKVRFCTAQEYITALSEKMDREQAAAGRQDRRRARCG